MKILSLEEIGKLINIEPDYDCETGYGWQQQQLELLITNHTGWSSLESFNTERIPWFEYCTRRENSTVDRTEYDLKYKSRRT